MHTTLCLIVKTMTNDFHLFLDAMLVLPGSRMHDLIVSPPLSDDYL